MKEREIIHLLKDSVVLVTNKGPKLPSKEIIHFSSSYLPDPDLEKLFPGIMLYYMVMFYYIIILLIYNWNSEISPFKMFSIA